MKIEVLMFFYMAVCASMILFNCTVLLMNVHRKKRINKRDRRLEPQIRAQIERLERGQELEEGHLRQINKNFKKVAYLKSFEDSMDDLRRKNQSCVKNI